MGIFIAAVALLAIWFYSLLDPDPQGSSSRLILGIVLILLSTGITILLLFGITAIFGYTNFKKGLLNFLIGDNGTYSLSRLQAVLWAVVIIAYQLQVVLCLCFNSHGNYFHLYEPVFSESVIWLLGLSLASSIAVKGITVSNATQNPRTISKNTVVPRLGDILVGDNGLDFSKCQMLIWTLLAIIVFESKCFFFNQELLTQSNEGVEKLFNHFYDEYNKNTKDSLDSSSPYVPYLTWSFVVLMGMSQGVYVGKKLVPSFKLGDIKASKQSELEFETKQLDLKSKILSEILSNTAPSPGSAIDKASKAAIEEEISRTKERIDIIKGDINQINNFLN
jgi:hypothetical protein